MSIQKICESIKANSISYKKNNNHLLFNKLFQAPSFSSNWKSRAILSIEESNQYIDKIIPNFFWQTKVDAWATYILSYFAPLTEFNNWLNSNGSGNWTLQLATYCAKLPPRSARNIIMLLLS